MQGDKKGDAASAADMVKVNKKLTNPYNTNTKPQPHPQDITIRSYGGLRPVLGGKYEEQLRNRKIVQDP